MENMIYLVLTLFEVIWLFQ